MGETTITTYQTIIVEVVEMVDEHHQAIVEDWETHQGITVEDHAVTQCLHLVLPPAKPMFFEK
jgi:hypothetical protein